MTNNASNSTWTNTRLEANKTFSKNNLKSQIFNDPGTAGDPASKPMLASHSHDLFGGSTLSFVDTITCYITGYVWTLEVIPSAGSPIWSPNWWTSAWAVPNRMGRNASVSITASVEYWDSNSRSWKSPSAKSINSSSSLDRSGWEAIFFHEYYYNTLVAAPIRICCGSYNEISGTTWLENVVAPSDRDKWYWNKSIASWRSLNINTSNGSAGFSPEFVRPFWKVKLNISSNVKNYGLPPTGALQSNVFYRFRSWGLGAHDFYSRRSFTVPTIKFLGRTIIKGYTSYNTTEDNVIAYNRYPSLISKYPVGTNVPAENFLDWSANSIIPFQWTTGTDEYPSGFPYHLTGYPSIPLSNSSVRFNSHPYVGRIGISEKYYLDWMGKSHPVTEMED